VPHYVSLTPSPRAALALCERLGELLGATSTRRARRGGERYSEQVSEAVASDEETAAYVEELERASTTDRRRAGPALRRRARRRADALPARARAKDGGDDDVAREQGLTLAEREAYA
jgi:hypothetical protein